MTEVRQRQRQDQVSEGSQHGGHRADANEDGCQRAVNTMGTRIEDGQCCFLSQLSASCMKVSLKFVCLKHK